MHAPAPIRPWRRRRRRRRMLLIRAPALLSAAIIMAALRPAGALTPQAWTTAALTLQAWTTAAPAPRATLPPGPGGGDGGAPPGAHAVLGPPSRTAAQIARLLASWQSPAAGTGAVWVAYGVQYGIDPAYALAFFIHESGAGTAPGWAGRKPDGGTTHTIGNSICAGYRRWDGRFRDDASWEEGIADGYRLIAVEDVAWRGVHTVEEIVPIDAPAVDNNVQASMDAVNRLVAAWRAAPP